MNNSHRNTRKLSNPFFFSFQVLTTFKMDLQSRANKNRKLESKKCQISTECEHCKVYVPSGKTEVQFDCKICNVSVQLVVKPLENEISRDFQENFEFEDVDNNEESPVNLIQFLTTEELTTESDVEAEDPDYQPPEDYEDVDDFDSDISSDEIKDLAESLEKDIAELAPRQLPEQEAKTVVSPNGDSEKLIEEEIPKVDVSQENKPEN